MNHRLKWKTTLSMIRQEVSSLSHRMQSLASTRDMRLECLSRMIPSSTLRKRVVDYIAVCKRRNGEHEEALLVRRLARLREIHGRSNDTGACPGRSAGPSCSDDRRDSLRGTVHNLSDRVFTETERGILERGLGFALAPRQVSVVDFAASVEFALHRVSVSDRAWMRCEVSRLLKSFKPKGDNLTRDEREALSSLRKMEDIIFLPADKGNSTVVLNRSSYEEKLEALIQDGPYIAVKRDPGKRFRKQLADLLKPLVTDKVLDRDTFLRWCPTHFEPPHLYGLPKIHKDGCPLRPIVSMRNSLFSPLGSHLAGILAPYYKQADSYVGSSVHAKRRLLDSLETYPDGRLGSFDVVNLFTQVPVEEASIVVESFLRNDEDLGSRTNISVEVLSSLIRFCLKSCYFIFRTGFYVQTNGVAMGSNLGCVAANIYMRFFEDLALRSAPLAGAPSPLLWIRYVDDALCMFRCDDDFDRFLVLLNSLRDSITFTLEMESEGRLSFLDILIRRDSSEIKLGIYRKPTHTDLYIRRDSCHPPQVFRGLVSCLKKRAQSICSASELPIELRHIRNALASNGYTERDLRPLNSRGRQRAASSEQEQPRRVVIPYLPGLSHRVKRCFNKAGLTVSMRPPPTLRSLLCKKKPANIDRLGHVYCIPCSDCGWSYVGETGRTLRERLAEHQRAVRNMSAVSEVANHVLENDHRIHWDGAHTLSFEPGRFHRLFKEAWFSKVRRSGNRVFHDLDKAWDRLLLP